MDEKQLVAAMEAAVRNIAKNEQVVASASAARRLNMDRFMRLSRKPSDMTIRGFNRLDGHQVFKRSNQYYLADYV